MSTPEPKRILVVEDEANLRELVRGRLEAAGYAVETADDGYAALKAARLFRPDLIILDLMLPKMDGYTVCRMLRSSTGETQVPVILFSARSSEDDRQRGMDSGANAYVTKPFDPPLLLDKIHELLDPEGWAASKSAEPAQAAPDAAPTATPEPVAPQPASPVAPGPAAPQPAPAVREPEPEPVLQEAVAADPAPGHPLTPEEQAARVRPAGPAETQAPASPGAAPRPAAGPRAVSSPVGTRSGGFLARLFGRLFGSRGRK